MPNRRSGQQRLARAVDEPVDDVPVCVAMLDVDHFKAVNDPQGHDVGDMLLRW